MPDPGTFSGTLWVVILLPLALLCIIIFVAGTSKRHVVTDPAEQKAMVERFREAEGS